MLNPTIEILVAAAKIAASVTRAAQNDCSAKYPDEVPRTAPATGLPMRMPSPPTENTIPMRAPILSNEGDRETTMGGGIDTKHPVKNP